LDIVEFFLNILKTLFHIIDIATDLMISHRKILNAIAGVIFGGCLIYFLKIDSISDIGAFPLALFLVCGIYLSYTFTTWVIAGFKRK
jgi:hypothetical protein